MNHDAYNTWPKNGPKSTYLYKDSAGPICFGPIWDFDYHTFTLYNDFEYDTTTWDNSENQRLYQWEILKMTNKAIHYLGQFIPVLRILKLHLFQRCARNDKTVKLLVLKILKRLIKHPHVLHWGIL